ncbi:MAG TPA: hypothetical protein PLJ21_08300, partial [Pseudobdellovibrionaceae bacterium]|nr:hypothetical protein [Pseudobdellovibrionaceae bacterium]
STNYFKHVNGVIYPGAPAAPLGSSILLALSEADCDAIPALQINKVMIDSSYNLKVVDGSNVGSTICTFNTSTGKCISQPYYTTQCSPGINYLFKSNIEFIATPEGINIMSIQNGIYRNGFFYWSN